MDLPIQADSHKERCELSQNGILQKPHAGAAFFTNRKTRLSHSCQSMKTFSFFSLLVLFPMFSVINCGQNPETARKELATLNLAYSPLAFVESAANGDMTAVRLFLDAGMSPNAKENGDSTPLLSAVFHGHSNVAALLLAHGASIDLGNREKTTPLMSAVVKGDTNLVKLLISKKADVSAIDKYGTTALMLAASNGDVSVMEALLAKGAKLTPTNSNGRTVLMHAVNKGNVPAIKFLVQRGASLKDEDEDGKSAYDFAMENKVKDSANALFELGARANSKWSIADTVQEVSGKITRISIDEARQLERANGQKADAFKETGIFVKKAINYCNENDFPNEGKDTIISAMLKALAKMKFTIATSRSSFDDAEVSRSVDKQIDALLQETKVMYEKTIGKVYEPTGR
jgi:ankyrin repeat protein